MTTLLAFRTIKDAETASAQLAGLERSSDEYSKSYASLTTAVGELEGVFFSESENAKRALSALRSKCFTLSPSITVSDAARREDALSEITPLLASLRSYL